MLFSPMTLVLAVIGGLALMLTLQWWESRTATRRLQTLLVHSGAAPAPLLPEPPPWLAKAVPALSDGAVAASLAQAGYSQALALPVFVTLRLGVSGGIALLILATQGLSAIGIFKAMLSAFLASRIFMVLLKMKAEARQQDIRRELPPVIDVLLMVLHSGVSIDQSLRYITGVLDGTAPIVNTALKRYVADIDAGVPYETAFERLGHRLSIPEGYDFAALIKQALLQGGEIVGFLDRFGAELSEKRVTAARAAIGAKAVQLTLVMLVFFMPVLMIALGGPAVSTIYQTLGSVKHQVHERGPRK